MADETKAAEASKLDELTAANQDEITRLQCDNESLTRVRYVTCSFVNTGVVQAVIGICKFVMK